MNELWERSAVDLAAMIRRREVSSRELLAATLARIDEINPAVNAIVTLVPEMAEEWAGEADAAIAHRTPGDQRQPFQPVPDVGRYEDGRYQRFRHPVLSPRRRAGRRPRRG